MLAVAVGDVAGEDGGDDERAVEANGADGVVEDAVVAPLFEGFFDGLGEAEVGYAGDQYCSTPLYSPAARSSLVRMRPSAS